MYGKRTDTCAAAAGFILTICQSMMQKVEDSFYRGVIGEDTELNKIYKVVWSRSKGCYVVASEFAKRHVGKVRSGSIAGRTTLLGLLVVHTLAAAPAYAVTGSGASSGFGSGPSGVSYTSTQPEGQNGLAIGVSGSTYAYGNANTVAIGTSSVAYGKSSVAIGGAVTGREPSLSVAREQRGLPEPALSLSAVTLPSRTGRTPSRWAIPGRPATDL